MIINNKYIRKKDINFWNSKLSWWLLIVAIVGDFLVPYLLAPFYKGYSHKLMVMSALGNPNSPVRVYYNAWLIILGVLLIVSAFNLYQKYSDISKTISKILLIVLLAFGVGAGIVAGIFSVNEDKKIVTLASQVHGFGAAFGFMALTFEPLFLAILSCKNKDKISGVICGVFFIFSIVTFIIFVMSDKPEFQKSFISFEGLWQRLTLLSTYIPLGYVAIKNMYKN